MKNTTGVVILAGGRSSRMQFPKCYLKVDGITLLEHLRSAYDEYVNSTIVVLNSEFAEGEWTEEFRNTSRQLQIVKNNKPESGRMHSLQMGIGQMHGAEYCFIQNIDNPVSDQTIEKLYAARTQGDYVVPVCAGKSGHPIIVSRKIMDAISMNKSADTTLRDILDDFRKKEVRVKSSLIHLNLNTPEDFSAYLQLTKK